MEDIQISLNFLIYIAGAITAIAAATAILSKVFKNAVNKAVSEMTVPDIKEQMNEVISDLKEDIKEIKTKLGNHTRIAESDICLIKKTLQDSIRDTITKAHTDCMAANFISDHEMFIVNELYSDYLDLDGNTFIPELVEDLRELYKICHKGKGKVTW